MTPAGMPVGFGSQGSASMGSLNSQPWIQPGAFRSWLRQWLGKSFLVGGGMGALAGAIPAALIAVFNWSTGSPLNWDLLVISAGVAGGLLRGWQPGYRFADVVDRYVGLKRFWQVIGLMVGAAVGSAFGMVCAWAIFPLIIGLVMGAQGGAYLGGRLWQAGKTVGWEKILGIIGALGAGALGWGAARLAAAAGLSYLGARVGAGLMPLAGDGVVESGLLWLLAGGLSGAVFGALGGMLVDLVARMLRLTD